MTSFVTPNFDIPFFLRPCKKLSSTPNNLLLEVLCRKPDILPSPELVFFIVLFTVEIALLVPLPSLPTLLAAFVRVLAVDPLIMVLSMTCVISPLAASPL